MLPIVISIVNKNRTETMQSTATLRSLYAAVASIVMSRMRADLAAVRQELRAHNISVMETQENQDGDSVHYPYVLRGQRGNFTIQRDAVKAEIGRRLNRYIMEVIRG